MSPAEFDSLLNALDSRMPFEVITVELQTGESFQIDIPRSTAFRNGVAVHLAAGCKTHYFNHTNVRRMSANPLQTPS